MARRKSVAVISAFDAPFIGDDVAILSTSFRVRRLIGNGPGALWRVVLSTFSSDIHFCWFLSVYGAVAIILAAVFGRPTVLVLGGVDVARDELLGYGLWLSPWKSILARIALRRADRVLVVAKGLRDDAVRLAEYDGGNIRYLPTGYDSTFWSPGSPGELNVLCVAAVKDEVRMMVKGIDVLLGAAKLLPGTTFTVVGVEAGIVNGLETPPNVSFVPAMDREALLPYYRGAKVYCQPSRREGLPNALCEAMLCGCVPAVTDAGASAHAVGATGFVAVPGDPAGLAAAIRNALDAPEDLGRSARERIVQLFPAEHRRDGLLDIMNQLTDD